MKSKYENVLNFYKKKNYFVGSKAVNIGERGDSSVCRECLEDIGNGRSNRYVDVTEYPVTPDDRWRRSRPNGHRPSLFRREDRWRTDPVRFWWWTSGFDDAALSGRNRAKIATASTIGPGYDFNPAYRMPVAGNRPGTDEDIPDNNVNVGDDGDDSNATANTKVVNAE